jgi:fumarate reductase flavoprotein subunit
VAAALGLSTPAAAEVLAPRPELRTLAAPYHLAWVTHGILTIQGGVVVDTAGRVLDAVGAPIQGLDAGGTACGLARPSSDGYSSGNGVLSAFGMDWITGKALATAGDPQVNDLEDPPA